MDVTKIDTALERFGAKTDAFTQIVYKDLNKYAKEVEAAFEENNAESLHIAAHSSKSIYSLIEADDALEIVKLIEQSSYNGDIAACKSLYKRLHPLYIRVNDHLKKRLGE